MRFVLSNVFLILVFFFLKFTKEYLKLLFCDKHNNQYSFLNALRKQLVLIKVNILEIYV